MRRAAAAGWILSWILSGVACAPFRSSLLGLSRTSTEAATPRAALNFQGVPGVIDVPVAEPPPRGAVLGTVGFKRDTQARRSSSSVSFIAMIPMLPFLGFAGRGTITQPEGPVGGLRDGAANLHMLLLDDGAYWPAVAIGATDFAGGAVRFQSKYAVVSKSWGDLLRLSLGYGTGPNLLTGAFAGLEVAPSPYFTLLAELDGVDPGFGIRLFPVPRSIEAYGVPGLSADLVWTRESGATAQVGLRYVLGEGKAIAQRSERARLRFGACAESREIPVEGLGEELVELGLEDVRVAATSSRAIAIEYENRRFNRSELDALGIVLGMAALDLPRSFETIEVVVRQRGLRVVSLTTNRRPLIELLDERQDADAFGEVLEVQAPSDRPDALDRVGARSPSAFKIDMTVMPSLEGLALTEAGAFHYRLVLFPEASVKLMDGLVLESRVRVPVAQSTELLGPLGSVELDRVMLRQAFRVPSFDEVPAWAQLAVGKYGAAVFGAGGELVTELFDGIGQLGLELARVGTQPDSLDRWYAIARAQARYDPWDVHAMISVGRYLDTDEGWRFELGRTFGSTEINAFVYRGDHGSSGGLVLRIPLTPAEELRPFWVRPTFPALAEYSIKTTVFEPGNWVRRFGGRELPGFHDVVTSTLDRGHLTPSYVRAHVDELSDAVRYWLEERACDPNAR
ncbi:MAG: YjbH domain-containing protein [Deltaproteobacteria bacterium]|nr:YjbH domain-containing protein [Deltaproteobacteria bacterium]